MTRLPPAPTGAGRYAVGTPLGSIEATPLAPPAPRALAREVVHSLWINLWITRRDLSTGVDKSVEKKSEKSAR